jgi:hypothetical protein
VCWRMCTHYTHPNKDLYSTAVNSMFTTRKLRRGTFSSWGRRQGVQVAVREAGERKREREMGGCTAALTHDRQTLQQQLSAGGAALSGCVSGGQLTIGSP